MGLFDLFNKGKKENLQPHADITLSHTDKGSHGDNIGGLIGFNNLESETGPKFINEHMALATTKTADLSLDNYKIVSSDLTDNPQLKLRVLLHKNSAISAYPYLKTSFKLPFATKEIIEWRHMKNAEAEIKGGGRDTFGLDFFPTDYAVNRSKYIQQKNINVNLSSVALVVDEHKVDPNSEVPYSEDFVAYLPSSSLPRVTYYDFIGKVINFSPVTLTGLGQGYIAKVKLINHDTDPNFLTVDMYMHQENMRIPELSIGLKISGLLWFQGELAE